MTKHEQDLARVDAMGNASDSRTASAVAPTSAAGAGTLSVCLGMATGVWIAARVIRCQRVAKQWSSDRAADYLEEVAREMDTARARVEESWSNDARDKEQIPADLAPPPVSVQHVYALAMSDHFRNFHKYDCEMKWQKLIMAPRLGTNQEAIRRPRVDGDRPHICTCGLLDALAALSAPQPEQE